MKKIKLQFIYCFLISLMFTGNVFPANEYFRSIVSGNWNATSTWEMSTNNGVSWIPANSTPTNLSGLITIISGNIVTVTVDVTADQISLQTGATLSIDPGITLTYPGNASTFTLTNATVSGAGTFKVDGSMTLDLKPSGFFSAGLNIASGTVIATDLSSPRVGKLYGPVTVDSGATLSPSMTGGVNVFHLEFYGSVTNNGTLIAGGFNNTQFQKSMKFKGSELVNNGVISTLTINLDTNMNLS
ncbi:MAG TPA: hypothetical protein PKD83_13650, partial [Ignavibacteria bacterium]|nr:hypothetical protein [Ignavibacteria bacterium]